jgi:hypothetical protein
LGRPTGKARQGPGTAKVWPACGCTCGVQAQGVCSCARGQRRRRRGHGEAAVRGRGGTEAHRMAGCGPGVARLGWRRGAILACSGMRVCRVQGSWAAAAGSGTSARVQARPDRDGGGTREQGSSARGVWAVPDPRRGLGARARGTGIPGPQRRIGNGDCVATSRCGDGKEWWCSPARLGEDGCGVVTIRKAAPSTFLLTRWRRRSSSSSASSPLLLSLALFL